MYPGCINRLRDEDPTVWHKIANGEIETDECHFQAALYLLAKETDNPLPLTYDDNT